MEANVTLHWFVHPLWFLQLGAFTKEENIPVFVEWAQLAFKLFGNDAAHSGDKPARVHAAQPTLVLSQLRMPFK